MSTFRARIANSQPRRSFQTHGREVARALRGAGLDGLHDEPRPGAPRTVSDEDVERVVTLTPETLPEDATHWSTRAMAQRTGLSSMMAAVVSGALELNTAPVAVPRPRPIFGQIVLGPDGV